MWRIAALDRGLDGALLQSATHASRRLSPDTDMTLKVEQRHWSAGDGWRTVHGSSALADAQLVLLFGSNDAISDDARLAPLRAAYPHAHLVGCSTAGEICGTAVEDDTLVATAMRFDQTAIRVAVEPLPGASMSAEVGATLAHALAGDGLRHVLVIAEGVHINGSNLVAGLRGALPEGVTVTGGLAGDGARFVRTTIRSNDTCLDRHVAAIGFYGDRFVVGHGSLGGWDPFGPERVITRSVDNVLYELDGDSALALYKEYLGAHAAALPSSGLLFPLSLILPDGTRLVRTILGVDEAAGSLTFAGDVPQGSAAQLMKANVDRLVDGAQGAADAAHASTSRATPALALLITCVGRKLVMNQRVEEELEAVRDVLGPDVALTGFYSYGEIAPFSGSVSCELHNQTMTITTFDER